MYKKIKIQPSTLQVRDTVEGETIETKILRMVENKEPIKDAAPLIYQERKAGVEAGYNIRTDRFDIALDAMTIVHRSAQAKRDYVPPTEEATGSEKSE